MKRWITFAAFLIVGAGIWMSGANPVLAQDAAPKDGAATTAPAEPELTPEEAEAKDKAAQAEAEAQAAVKNKEIPDYLGGTYYWEATKGDDGWELTLRNLNEFRTNNLWIMIAAMLVFIMHLGFAMVESGLTRAKNTVNILFKNTMIPCIGLVMYAVCGWMIMYPVGDWIIENYFAF